MMKTYEDMRQEEQDLPREKTPVDEEEISAIAMRQHGN